MFPRRSLRHVQSPEPRHAYLARKRLGDGAFPFSVKDLDRIYEQVLGEVRAQYTLGYVSTNEKPDGAKTLSLARSVGGRTAQRPWGD